MTWRELANDQTFWSTIAAASTALLIAVVLEGRSARTEMDVQEEEKRKQDQVTWDEAFEIWKKKEQDHRTLGTPHPGDAPSLIIPVAPRRAGRTTALLIAVWSLAVALVGSVVTLLPAGYIGGPCGALGLGVTLASFVVGTGCLVGAATSRIRTG